MGQDTGVETVGLWDGGTLTPATTMYKKTYRNTYPLSQVL